MQTISRSDLRIRLWKRGHWLKIDGGTAQGWNTISGSWSVVNGYYAQTANNYPDIVVYDDQTWGTDFIFSASLRTSWSALNNRLGMIYNYVDSDNYAYVIFNAGGLAEINQVTDGAAPVVVASGPYSGGGSGVCRGRTTRLWFGRLEAHPGTGTAAPRRTTASTMATSRRRLSM